MADVAIGNPLRRVATGIVAMLAGSIWLTLASIALLAAIAVMIGIRFELTPTGSLALYFVVWWTVLFAILPVRVASQAEVGEIVPGTEPAAPHTPALRERAIWTTIVSDVVFAGVAIFFPLAGL